MPIEIERKFLVTGNGWRGLGPATLYRQGYLCRDKERTVRVRLAGDTARLTIKGRNTGGVAAEFEYRIPLADAQYMLDNIAEQPIIEKKRHKVPFRGFIWEVDEFLGDNTGLILAEVELRSVDQSFALPDWAGKDVTGDPRYFNSNLVTNPYRQWKDSLQPNAADTPPE